MKSMRSRLLIALGATTLIATALSRQSQAAGGDVVIPDCSDCNFIIVTQDVLRATHTTPYGYERETTPAMGKAANRGLRFDKGYSPASWTVPSVCSLLSISNVTDTGLFFNWDPTHESWNPISKKVVTLGQVLSKQGIESHVFVETDVLVDKLEIQRGFTSWEVYPHKSQPVDAVVQKLTDSKKRGKRFFAYVHYRGIHIPLKPPESYQSLFVDAPLPYGKAGFGKPKDDASPEEAQNFINAYDQTARWYDDALGSLLAGLAKADLTKKTYILFTADHGTSLGEGQKGRYNYGPRAYDEVLHVPMVLVGPGIAAGSAFPKPVSQLDVAYTVLKAMGVNEGDAPWRGVDLREQVPSTVVSFAMGVESARNATHRVDVSLDSGKATYFAIGAEDTPIPAEQVPQAAELLAAAKRVIADGRALNAAPAAAAPAQTIDLNASELEALKALGYVE